MTETWLPHFTRDRHLHCGGRVPVGCRVANVLRIENHKAFARYRSYKEALRIKQPGPCAEFRVRTSGRINLLDDHVNEAYLFHGTTPESAQSIARDVFRVDRAGSGMFGGGAYLAEASSKSDEYAKEGGGVYVGLCAMLLCRCALGKVLTVSEAGDMQERLRAGGWDSLCGDRLAAVGTFREMVARLFDSVDFRLSGLLQRRSGLSGVHRDLHAFFRVGFTGAMGLSGCTAPRAPSLRDGARNSEFARRHRSCRAVSRALKAQEQLQQLLNARKKGRRAAESSTEADLRLFGAVEPLHDALHKA